MILNDLCHMLNNILRIPNNIWSVLEDIYYVRILGKHKHQYKRIKDGRTEIRTRIGNIDIIKYQRHQCSTCKKIVGLDDWQINDMPTSMLYEKIYEINHGEIK